MQEVCEVVCKRPHNLRFEVCLKCVKERKACVGCPKGRERGRNGDGGEQLQYVAAGRQPEKVKDEKGRED